jgi:hypothetical protein
MSDLLILFGLGLCVVFIVFAKAIWQWVLGTDVLIEQSKKQTELLREILKTK